MSKQQHTPGPWKRRKNVVSGPFGVTVVQCMDNGTWGEKGCHSITKIEAEANARLIATAPELLEALESIIASADAGNAAILNRLLDQARAAIAKAKGEQA